MKTKNEEMVKKAAKLKAACIAVAVIVVIVAVTVSVVIISRQPTTGETTTLSVATLEKVLEISDLSTAEHTYNSIATKYNDKGEAQYYVAYEGTVSAEIDFGEIKIDMPEGEYKVIITVPAVEPKLKMDFTSMDFIFLNKKAENEKVTAEAQDLCEAHLAQRVAEDTALLGVAKENTKQTVLALFKPLVESLDSSYSVEIIMEGE